MGIEAQTRQIGEHEYTVRQFGAKLGNRVLLKLVKTAAPVFLAAAAAGNLKEIDVEGVAGALASVSEDDFEWLVDQFAASTSVQVGDKAPELKAVLDIHFAGRYLDELAWLKFAIEVNYGPFLSDLRRRAAEKLGAAKAPSSSSSPGTSTGLSSAS